MTLIINEIHILENLNRSVIVFAADRRITIQGKYDSVRKKLFKIEYLNAGISYFGLALVFPNGKETYLSEWLPAFIRNQSDAVDMQDFADRLRNTLNTIVPPQILKAYPSGFHLAGHNAKGYPDFFYVSNIGRLDKLKYVELRSQYYVPSSHFLNRDARGLGWDSNDPNSIRNKNLTYRNGDIKAHVVAWEKLDEIFNTLFQFPDFKSPITIDDYEHYVKAKFEMIAYVYRQFAKTEIIARPIDVFCLSHL